MTIDFRVADITTLAVDAIVDVAKVKRPARWSCAPSGSDAAEALQRAVDTSA